MEKYNLISLDIIDGLDNKFYVVEDANRASEGFSQSWWPHIWRVKVGPMTDTQEFQDIMETDTDVLSTYASEIEISDTIIEAAEEENMLSAADGSTRASAQRELAQKLAGCATLRDVLLVVESVPVGWWLSDTPNMARPRSIDLSMMLLDLYL